MGNIYSTSQKVILGCSVTLLFCVGIYIFVISPRGSPSPCTQRLGSSPSPPAQEVSGWRAGLFSQKQDFFLIDINSASSDELCLIPYISQGIADEIIKYRQEKGYIHDSNDLLDLKGIGPQKLKRLKKYIKF